MEHHIKQRRSGPSELRNGIAETGRPSGGVFIMAVHDENHDFTWHNPAGPTKTRRTVKASRGRTDPSQAPRRAAKGHMAPRGSIRAGRAGSLSCEVDGLQEPQGWSV
ncbi:hypothetical protein E2C01_057368 [Portunus trituberculatus]|uniref:Uncharacterized protein n=1 Tax=Portunus trituberculatus TaxID=210409 RepID=A0A5B7GWL1_PORTR|nr:hypothetical protein [Portunus trituberculatus]